ncbi:MAG: TetR family transcriptional regulator [Novosphingobium sp.]|nr:TetR family transcriptional regulator [Novosphingobium sp.]MCP5403439.1 TetR family transcriptional regulator [Novosphingobium sp.]
MTVPKGRIRKRDAAATRARILAAAQSCFSLNGYANTGIRDIAAEAGVSYTLVGRYFGSKAGLLEAALEATLKAEPFLEIERESFGENLARLIVGSVDSALPTSMTILAAGDPEAREVVTRIVRKRIVQRLAEWLGPPAAEERAAAITMLGAGFVTHSRFIPLLGPPEALDLRHPTVRWLAHTLQMLVDDRESWRAMEISPPNG